MHRDISTDFPGWRLTAKDALLSPLPLDGAALTTVVERFRHDVIAFAMLAGYAQDSRHQMQMMPGRILALKGILFDAARPFNDRLVCLRCLKTLARVLVGCKHHASPLLCLIPHPFSLFSGADADTSHYPEEYLFISLSSEALLHLF